MEVRALRLRRVRWLVIDARFAVRRACTHDVQLSAGRPWLRRMHGWSGLLVRLQRRGPEVRLDRAAL